MEIKEILYKSPSIKDRLQIKFTSCYRELIPERTLVLFTLYVTHIARLRVRPTY